MGKPRVIIADDRTMLVEALERLLAPECEVIAKVADGRALLAAVAELHHNSWPFRPTFWRSPVLAAGHGCQS
jgi:hypothetical protein